MILVLIVDDNTENLYMLRALLQGNGCDVNEARNGAEALNRAREAPPDLIISDLLMPVMDGYTLLRHWKADELLRQIPFIVYTATYTDPKDKTLALDLGADAFIIKPLDPEPFWASIQDILKQKENGKPSPNAVPEIPETGLMQEYSEVLVRKLEKKVFQLEQLKISLEEDIARREQVEAALRTARQDWEDIFQAIGHPILILDINYGILAANKSALKASGRSLDAMLTSRCYDIFHKDSAPPQGCPMDAILQSGSMDTVEMEVEALGCHYLVSCTPVLGEDGKIEKIIHIAADITDRKLAEEALRVSEEKYRRLFEESPAPVFVNLVDGKITDANKAFEDLLGYTRKELIGASIIELYADPEDRPGFRSAVEEAGFVKDYPIRFKKKDGTPVNCITSASVQRSEDGKIKGYRGILRDLTVEKSLQAQLLQAQKMDAFGALAGGVAHDFNNILQVVLGYTDLLLTDEKLPPSCLQDLKTICEAARRGADLVQRLLIFSRKVETRHQPTNLNFRITELRKMLERTIPKMIGIEVSLAEDLARINADPLQIDQVLMNLAVNARDAMPDGGKLIIETANIVIDKEYAGRHVDVKPGRYVLLTVTDTGIGMNKDIMEHIFEPFFTTKEAGKGTGLGLAIVHGIVKQHGGHVKCYSELGVGTTFKIYLPYMAANEKIEEVRPRQMPRGGSETILLVDDEESIRKFGSTILKKAGYYVITASNGKEALEKYIAHSKKIALVILDFIMPEMGGKKCLEGLLGVNPYVKVVIASGYSGVGHTKDALEQGARGFLNKPYDIYQMLEVVRTLLDEEKGA